MPKYATSRPLWSIRGIVPFFAVGFLGAFNLVGLQALLRNVVLESIPSGGRRELFQALVHALILIPYVLFFTPAAFLSDKWAKDRVVRWTSAAVLTLSIVLVGVFQAGSGIGAFSILFLLAILAAIFSPSKYGLIKEIAGNRKLAEATAVVLVLTVVAGLAANVFYTALFDLFRVEGTRGLDEIVHQVRWASWPILGGALAQWLLAWRVPAVGVTDHRMRFSWKRYLRGGSLVHGLMDAWKHVVVRQAIIGLSMFFAVAQILVANIGAYVRETSGQSSPVAVYAILAAAAVGLAAGAVYAARLSRNFIETGLVPTGAAGISVLMFVLPYATQAGMLGVLFFGFGLFGGMFLVPLHSLIQFHTRRNTAGHILAASNFWENVLMLVFLALPALLSWAGVPQRAIFAGLGAISLAGSVWAMVHLPQSLIRTLIRGVFSSRFSLEVLGLDSLPAEGGVLFLGNHISLLDWAFLQMACPRPMRFLMDRSHYEKWYLKWLLDWLGAIPMVGDGSDEAFAQARRTLEEGGVVALFPEGHLSRNGLLSNFKPGYEKAVAGTGAAIIPFYIQGLWGSIYSHAAAGYRKGLLSLASHDITVVFGASLPDSTSAEDVRRAVQELSIVAWTDHVSNMRPLVSTWIRTARRVGSAPAIFSHDGQDLSGTRLLGAVLAFARRLEEIAPDQQNVGILLPTSSAGAIANLACLVRGRTIVNLNYTQPAETIVQCARRAGLRTIVSSHQFEAKLASRGFDVEALSKVANVVRLEDIKDSIPKAEFVRQVLRAKFLPAWWLELVSVRRGVKLSDTAAIMFSSGSEGVPKGVELSHANMMGNIRQTGTVLNPTRDDVMLSCLPLFHAFGLTITTIMPLVEGIPISMQPDPTDARSVGRACARHKVTILCGAGTFMRLYVQSKAVHPLMFASLRLVVAGAEKLKPEVRQSFREKFGLEVYEGYGTTETTPVASTNLPDSLLDDFTVQVSNRPGTVGIPLPGSQFRIVDPDTLEALPIGEAGLILIGGTQIMKGYLDDPVRTASVVVEIDGKRWYKTGDKGRIDADGFLQILDRYSRFAKIGGEMVSLGLVEQAISEGGLLSPCEFVAVAVPDLGKGERIVLLYSAPEGQTAPEPETIRDRIRSCGMPPLSQPSLLFEVESVPHLGTGKADYGKAKELALSLAG